MGMAAGRESLPTQERWASNGESWFQVLNTRAFVQHVADLPNFLLQDLVLVQAFVQNLSEKIPLGSVKQPGRTDPSWAMAPDLELPWWDKDCQHGGRLHASGTEMPHNGPDCMEHAFQRSSLTPWLPLLSLWMLFPSRSGAGLIPNNLEGPSISLWSMIDFWRETRSTTSQSLPTVLKQT